MLYFVLGALALAVLSGLWILRNWLTSAHTGRGLVYAHGLFAALGLGLLLFFVRRHPAPRYALMVLALAAVGGFYMFFRDLKGKFSPTPVALIDALVAVGGFFLLLLSAI